MDPRKLLEQGDALLIVDVQNDFCPGGALPVPEGDQVIAVLNDWINAAVDRSVPVIASRDWHPVDHCSFEHRGGPWPVHCVQDTHGAAFHDRLQLPPHTIRVSKGTRFDQDAYSAFENTGLAGELRRRNIKRLWVGGLAQDVCVRDTVVAGAGEGFDMRVIRAATRPVDPANGRQALQDMQEAGARIEEAA